MSLRYKGTHGNFVGTIDRRKTLKRFFLFRMIEINPYSSNPCMQINLIGYES